MLGFLAREDIVPVELPSLRSPCEVVVLRGETTSSWLSLVAEIDQFCLEEEGEEQEELVIHVLDSEDELDRLSGVRISDLVIVRVDNNSEQEEEMRWP